MTEKGSCIIAEGCMKGLYLLIVVPFFWIAYTFNMFLPFFVTLLSMQDISQPMVAVLLPVNPKKEMACILGIDLRSLN